MMNTIFPDVHNGIRLDDPRYGSLWELVAPTTGSLKSIGFAWVEVIPGAESPLHFHKETDELYFIVRGHGQMTMNGETTEVGPGATIAIPIGVPHSIRSGSSGLDFVAVTCPPYDPDDDFEL